MDCGKSWELMMKKTDGFIRDKELSDLESHTTCCEDCRERWETLQTAICELESVRSEAPENIEKSVMSRLCFVRRKEKAGMMPYVVPPVAILAGLLAIFMFNAYKAGPVTMIDETARILSTIVTTLQTVASVAQQVLGVPYLAEALAVFVVGSVIGAAVIILKHIRLNGNRMNWRASK